MFLTDEEIERLTGRKQKLRQVEALRLMGLAFRVNVVGRPIVARTEIEGRQGSAAEPAPAREWRPNVLKHKGVNHGPKSNRQSKPAQGGARPA